MNCYSHNILIRTMLHLLAIPWAWVSDINIVKSKINLQGEKKVPVHICEKIKKGIR